MKEFKMPSEEERVRRYREFVNGGAKINTPVLKKAAGALRAEMNSHTDYLNARRFVFRWLFGGYRGQC